VPLLCQSVLAAFFPIKEEGNCLYPARTAAILPSPAFQELRFPAKSPGLQDLASKAQPWPSLARTKKTKQGSASPRCTSPGTKQVGTWAPVVPRCT